ncbi:putative serine protease K12H4.7 [Trichosurus vulpecula]|uniref:putative serine protease K12H4.7 n=1 Tax=Trichosurus vulpecula TaxID=9337 RepID=UPI00186ADB62|nr:putative serine protease K12H4.7 [Trichosurus vulpecula]
MLLLPLRGWWLLLLVPLLFGTYTESKLGSFRLGIYPKVTDHPDQQWLWQRLDHFDKRHSEFWRQRFFVNDRFYRPGGPVFLELGGEQSAVDSWTSSSSLLRYAKRMGAMYILLEHRYYGKSHPTEDISTHNLRFLSSRQALKDALYFRKFLTHKLRLFRNKWVVFGGSYAGSLAAWLREKHPRMFHSAVAYSAPIYAKANFSEYLEVVQNALFRHGHSECVDAVRNASQVLMHMLKHKKYHSAISNDFRLCERLNIDSEVKMSYFLETLITKISAIVQYNKKRPWDQDPNYNFEDEVTESDVSINYFCQVMTDKSLGTPYERYARFFVKTLESPQHCLDANYEGFIASVSRPEWDGEAAEGNFGDVNCLRVRKATREARVDLSGRACFSKEKKRIRYINPMRGQFQSSNYYIDQCEAIFDLGLDVYSVLESVDETNKYYYTPLIKNGRRILFVNGDIDPWHIVPTVKRCLKTKRMIQRISKPHDILSSAPCSDGYLKGGTEMRGIDGIQRLASECIT